jgi:hypothetical protein
MSSETKDGTLSSTANNIGERNDFRLEILFDTIGNVSKRVESKTLLFVLLLMARCKSRFFANLERERCDFQNVPNGIFLNLSK